jgi:hypothetical protein
VTTLKRTLPLAAAAFLMLASQALAVPLPGVTQTFGISPARRHVIGRPGMALTPTTVTNGTNASYSVSVFPAILSQDLSGAFMFAETPAALNDSNLALTTSPDSFTMPAGSTHAVDLHWNVLPAGQKWLAMGVVFQGTALGQTGSVHVVTRLLSVNFLSLPGLNRISGAFTGVFAQQLSPRVLQILARVKNTGNTFGAPLDGRLTIRDSLGDVVYGTQWTGDVVLPGAQRDFPINVHKLLPAGTYTASVTMHFGGERSRSTAFTLVGPNQLPTPAITIRDFNATGVIGSPAHVTARILSSGTAPAGVTLHLFLGHASDAAGATAIANAQLSYRNLAPGTVTQLSRPLGGGLHPGSYRVIATWVDPTGAPRTAEADFTPTVGQSLSHAIWAFIKHHALLFFALLLLALLMAMAWIVRRMRGGQREIQAELAAVRAELQAVGRDGGGKGRKPAAPRSARARTATSTTPTSKAKPPVATPARSRTTPARPGTPAKSNGVKSNEASAVTKSSTAKAATPAKAESRAKATRARPAGPSPARARPAGPSPARARPNGVKATDVKSTEVKSNRAKANGTNANGAKANGAKANGAKASESTRRATPSAGARTAAGNRAKPAAAKPSGAKPAPAKPTAAQPAVAKPNGAKATAPSRGTNVTRRKAAAVNPSGGKSNGAKSNGAASNGSKPAARSRSTGAKSKPAAITATPTQAESTPPNQSGTGAELRSTDVRATRAGELLALASRSHARRPLPSDRDDA